MTRRRITVTSAWGALAVRVGALAFALVAAPALAQQAQPGAGYVSNLSGPLFAVKADGARRVLSMRSVVNSGDTLVTEDKTYARVRFSDTSEVTLRPGTQFQIEKYVFDRSAPEKDASVFRLFKGALRTVTGLVGKRGDADAYSMSTPTATMGIRGTVFGVTVCLPGSCGGLATGTYVNVIDGRVVVAPPASPTVPPLLISAGQFAYAPPAGPPVQLPSDPGVGALFAPPPGFSQRPDAPPPGPLAGTPTTTPVNRPTSGECEVR